MVETLEIIENITGSWLDLLGDVGWGKPQEGCLRRIFAFLSFHNFPLSCVAQEDLAKQCEGGQTGGFRECSSSPGPGIWWSELPWTCPFDESRGTKTALLGGLATVYQLVMRYQGPEY